MALLQFMSAGLTSVKTPTSVHTDHLITAKSRAQQDMRDALDVNSEVYKFLETACSKVGDATHLTQTLCSSIKPSPTTVRHRILEARGRNLASNHLVSERMTRLVNSTPDPYAYSEQYAYPGGLMIGSDSHTPNAAGLNMLGIGVGGMEAVDVMAGLTYQVTNPNVIGVSLKGKLNGWSTPKDIILKVASLLTVKGGTGSIIEYFGPGVDTMSATGMGTIGNMGAEVGATCTIFPYTTSMADYLHKTRRSDIVAAANEYKHDLRADEGCEYDKVLEIVSERSTNKPLQLTLLLQDLSTLEPHINGPFTPDLSYPISQFKDAVLASDWPTEISASLIGSYTNSSYEDLSRSASLAKQATDAGLKTKLPFFVAPGSEEIRKTVERDGVFDDLREGGATLFANACGAW